MPAVDNVGRWVEPLGHGGRNAFQNFTYNMPLILPEG